MTRDEIPDPQNLSMYLDVSGHRYQDGSTRTMHFDVATIVSHLSEFMSLQPGDVISTGTPPGVGLGQEELVGAGRVELPTPTMSTWCSTTELRACRTAAYDTAMVRR